MKKFFKNLLKTILVVGLIVLIVWVVLYFTVPKVKEWTNEKFHISANKDDKEDEEKKALQDENGITFSSKLDSTQPKVYYNYTTGECTELTEA